MARMTRTLLLLLALGGLSSAAVADNWDRFRGPNGTGTANDKDIPVTFGAKENVLWKIAVPGLGNSSPVIWGKHLFLQSASKDGKERMLICLDTTDGKTLWQKTIPGTTAKVHGINSLATSTPTTDGEAVYVMFWDGKDIIATAYDFQGGKLWSKNLGWFSSQHGAGGSPILYKDKLIFADDMDKEDYYTKTPVTRPSVLFALNKKTGQIVWETPREAVRACYSAPFLLHKAGQAEPDLVIVSTTAITGYNLETGARSWESKDWQGKKAKMPLRTVASSALAGDVLIACSGDGRGDRLTVALELPGAGKTGAPQRLWDNDKDFPYTPSPLIRGENVYFVSDAGYAGCYDARTGKRRWYERLTDSSNYFTASPLLIDGKVYAAHENGEVFVFAAEPTYQLLAQNTLGERIRATPAVADGRLYVRGERHLFCIGKGGSGVK